MLTVRKEQVGALREAAIDRYCARVAGELRQQFGERLAGTSEEKLRQQVREAVDKAKGYGVTSAVDVKRYAEYTVEYSPDFDKTTWASAILNDSLTGTEKMDGLDNYTTFELRS